MFAPLSAEFKNNRSAAKNFNFATKAIEKLLKAGLARETLQKAIIISPLSVPENKDKKRLLLRYVNKHLMKDHVKYDDWKFFEDYLSEDSQWIYNFDIKSGYHHVDIFEPQQTFLGFSWNFNGSTRSFVFSVKPLGLGSAPYIFTKIMRMHVNFWRKQGIAIAVYLDDGMGAGNNYQSCLENSSIVKQTLILSGFVTNDEKSNLFPSKCLT